MNSIIFRKLIDLQSLPKDWELIKASLDWSGNPLLLIREGKPKPPPFSDHVAFSKWYQTPPKAHVLIHWTNGRPQTIHFEQSQGLSTYFVQQFGEGWLLADRRFGRAVSYDRHGGIKTSLDLGDASEDIRTTPDGRIWVSYFDEGVFGNGIGRQGLVCFDNVGSLLFTYGQFAERNNLPMICDCYGMNVTSSGDVWISYYTDFPLVLLRAFETVHVWPEVGHIGHEFAIQGNTAIFRSKSDLFSLELDGSAQPLSIDPLDESGSRLTPRQADYVGMYAAGSDLIIATETALYKSIR